MKHLRQYIKYILNETFSQQERDKAMALANDLLAQGDIQGWIFWLEEMGQPLDNINWDFIQSKAFATWSAESYRELIDVISERDELSKIFTASEIQGVEEQLEKLDMLEKRNLPGAWKLDWERTIKETIRELFNFALIHHYGRKKAETYRREGEEFNKTLGVDEE